MSKAGRKKIEINWVQLDSYLRLAASKKMCAALLDVSEDTIERRIQQKYGCSFTDYAEKNLAPIKLKIIQKAMSKAINGDNTLIIFCLKNLCGWRDKQADENDVVVNNFTQLSDEQIEHRINELKNKVSSKELKIYGKN